MKMRGCVGARSRTVTSSAGCDRTPDSRPPACPARWPPRRERGQELGGSSPASPARAARRPPRVGLAEGLGGGDVGRNQRLPGCLRRGCEQLLQRPSALPRRRISLRAAFQSSGPRRRTPCGRRFLARISASALSSAAATPQPLAEIRRAKGGQLERAPARRSFARGHAQAGRAGASAAPSAPPARSRVAAASMTRSRKAPTAVWPSGCPAESSTCRSQVASRAATRRASSRSGETSAAVRPGVSTTSRRMSATASASSSALAPPG